MEEDHTRKREREKKEEERDISNAVAQRIEARVCLKQAEEKELLHRKNWM